MVSRIVVRMAAPLVIALCVASCGKPGDGELRFTGPGADGRASAAWRVRIESATVELNDDVSKPYRGVVKSSWYADGEQVHARGTDSNLPLELTSNGLAQDCWALWEKS